MRLSAVVVAVWVATAAATAVGAHGLPAVPPRQELAVLLTTHSAVDAPGRAAATGVVIRPVRPITGEQTTLPVVGRVTAPDGVGWLRVRLPGRPNGRAGWIKERGTASWMTPWHVVVRTGIRRVFVYRDGRLARSFPAVVGKPSTPTPTGEFFVEENVQMLPDSAGGPFALALSARSNVLQEFEGGDGQIAIHGVLNLVGVPGAAVSHGCIRLGDHDIRWLAAHITTGVPVTIS